MTYQTLLFSFQGRIGRRTYWLWNLGYYIVMVVLILLSNRWFPSQAFVVQPLLMAVMLIPDLAVTAKRWHDRDKSSWWLLLNVPLVLSRMVVPVGDASIASTPTLMDTGLALGALLCGLWISIECGFLTGTDGDNRFGKPPH